MFYFICVNYNNSDYTEALIKSVINQEKDSFVIVVDNCSNEQELKKLNDIESKYNEKVRLIKSDVNLGYFGGLNLGLKGLPRNHPIVVGNNDLVYESNFTQIISQTPYPDDALVIAPNVITKDGYHQNPHCRKRVSKFRKFLYDIYFSNYIAALVLTWGSRFLNYLKGGRNNSFDQGRGYIHMGIGACYVLMPSFFKYFDELDNKVFLYGEEAYLAGQLMEVNGKIFYEPDAIVHHEESATLAKVASKTKYGYMKSSYYDYKKYL